MNQTFLSDHKGIPSSGKVSAWALFAAAVLFGLIGAFRVEAASHCFAMAALFMLGGSVAYGLSKTPEIVETTKGGGQ